VARRRPTDDASKLQTLEELVRQTQIEACLAELKPPMATVTTSLVHHRRPGRRHRRRRSSPPT